MTSSGNALAEAPPGGLVTALVMQNSSQGWIGTADPDGGLWRTDDGGKSWARVRLGNNQEAVRSIRFYGRTASIHMTRSIWTTSDSGDSWIEVSPTPALTATPGPGAQTCPAASRYVARLDDKRCWMIANLGAAGGTVVSKQLFRSRDGGVTWVLLAQTGFEDRLAQPVVDFGQLPTSDVNALLFISDDVGWMGTGQPGPGLFRTRDGGATWTAAPGLDCDADITSISFTDATNGEIESRLGVWDTSDGGDTWHLVATPTPRPQ